MNGKFETLPLPTEAMPEQNLPASANWFTSIYKTVESWKTPPDF